MSLAEDLAKIITAPDFISRSVVIEGHALIDAYLAEWWPLYYRQLSNIVSPCNRDPFCAEIVLEHWLASQRPRIETMRFIRGHQAFERMCQASPNEALAWLHRALGSMPPCTPEDFAEFVMGWVPQIIRETYAQLDAAAMALRPVLASTTTLH